MFFAALLVVTALSSVDCIPVGELYPFGADAGDSLVPRTDDGSSGEITLNRVYPFYGVDHFSLFINNNGLISFVREVRAFSPITLPLNGTSEGIDDVQLIAPFWGDVDTRPDPAGGFVWYRETTSQADLDRAQGEIRGAFNGQPLADSFIPRLVFIATWDHVGSYNQQTTDTNTFQCVLVSDGFTSYVIFLYANELIQWTYGSASSMIPAQVGFNAGDRVRFASHPYSQTDAIINIWNSSIPAGQTKPGVLIYRVDGTTITTQLNCDTSADAELVLTPSFGNQLGGTPVLVRGRCREGGDIRCFFAGSGTIGRYVDNNTVLCTTPVVNTLGSVGLNLRRVDIPARIVEFIASTTFTNVPPNRFYQVDFSVESSPDDMQLYFKAGDVIKLTWIPSEVVPRYLTNDPPEDIMINIRLFQQYQPSRSMSSAQWIEVGDTLKGGLGNTGSVTLTIPEGLVLQDCLNQNNSICPVAFKVSAVEGTMVKVTGTDQVVALPSGERTPETGIWSAMGYLQPDNATDPNMFCNEWFQPEPDNRISQSLLDALPTCPPTLAQAIVDSRFRRQTFESTIGDVVSGYAEAAMKFFHPNASVCYLQIVMATTDNDVPSQQCCYNDNGVLVTGDLAGGHVEQMSPLVNFNAHNMNDLLPFAFCCRGSTNSTKCDLYDVRRPSIIASAEAYELPVPACVFGDPHIVTLDGHKYTFNGKGEFVLIETPDNSFTLQGRMTQLEDEALGTVFTALVAHQVEGATRRTVEFQVTGQGDLEVLVDRVRVNFAEMPEQDFQQVVVTDRGNSTVVAEFSGGSTIEIRVLNRIISVMLITIPIRYRSLTTGLMGNYNRNNRDDLRPRGSSISISVDSSVEEIFELGNTWMINDEAESLFAYNRPGDTFDTFRDLTFTPAFEPVFDDPELEMRAEEICGDDEFCKFDIAATKDEDIGMSTMLGVRDFDNIVELAQPIVCVPSCGNGTCVATNTCSCSVGFDGERCSNRIERECDFNMCENNGTCVQHVNSFTCNCPEGFIGLFCQEREPPFSVTLINSSPRITNGGIAAEFEASKTLSSATCGLITVDPFLFRQVDCSSGVVRFSDVSSGAHRLRIVATTSEGERVVERRKIVVCDDEEDSCGVNLINEGVTVSGDCVRVQFTGCGGVESYQCKLNDGSFTTCRSPMQYCGLAVSSDHKLQVLPLGSECMPRNRLTVNFEVI